MERPPLVQVKHNKRSDCKKPGRKFGILIQISIQVQIRNAHSGLKGYETEVN